MVNDNNEKFQNCMSTMFSNLRSHDPYWQSVKLNLKAHTAILGPPTWFLTLNPDLENWVELHRAYSKIYNEKINKENINFAIAKDPVVFSRYFQRRLQHFLCNVLYSPLNPIGKIIHHFV